MFQALIFTIMGVATLYKVEALVVNHLSDFGADGEEYEVMEFFFVYKDSKYGGC